MHEAEVVSEAAGQHRLTETLRRQSALIESAFLKAGDLSKLQVLGAGKFSLRGALSTVEFRE